MKKILSGSLAFIILFSVVSMPISASAASEKEEVLMENDTDNYKEFIEISEYPFSLLSVSNDNDNGEENVDLVEVVENAVVENSSEERIVITKDSDGNEINVHYNKETDELVIDSDAYTKEELQEAINLAREFEFGFEESTDEEQVFSVLAAADKWTYQKTTKGNTKILKGTLTLTQVALAGYLGLTGLPGAIFAVAAWVWDSKVPTVYYSHKDYTKRKPNFSTKQVWQFYKDSKRSKKIGSTWTKIRVFYD